MAKFSSATWTDTEATDWEAGDVFRYDKFRDQFGQNIEYVKASIDNLTTSQYWELYEARLQSGLIPGGPFA